MGLLARFSLLSIVAFAVIGVMVARVLDAQIKRRALDDSAAAAALVARFGIQPQLSPTDLERGLAPEAVASIDRLLAAGYSDGQLKDLTVFNASGRIVYATDHALIGRRWSVSGDQAAELLRETSAHVTGATIVGHVPLRFTGAGRAGGAFEVRMPYAPVAASIRADRDRLYAFLGFGLLLLWGALSRIVARASRTLRRHAAHTEHLAHHDALTGLPNRTLFYVRVREALDEAGEHGHLCAVMLLDLDRFKEVNDTLGHHSGDLLLQAAGARAAGVLRDGDVIARLGGDEFAVLLPKVADERSALAVAERIRHALGAPFELDMLPVAVEASVGIAIYPDHGRDVDELIQRADVAMYAAKAGAAPSSVYDSGADPYSPERLAMVGRLRAGIDRGELELHYQPKADLATGTVSSVEALARWRHPELGLLPPSEFVSLAEQTGLIRPMTFRLLDDALAQCAAWDASGLHLNVAINVSVRNLSDTEMPGIVAARLRAFGLDADRLTLEITESSLMSDRVRTRQVLDEFSDMGVALSIDDFGTGYSSLAYLSDLPVGELKIDRGFVSRMSTTRGDAFIVRATIDLGRNLGLRVVAEGVETEKEWVELARLGCDAAQGYYLARPMPARELTAWLDAAGPRWAAQRAGARHVHDNDRRESA